MSRTVRRKSYVPKYYKLNLSIVHEPYEHGQRRLAPREYLQGKELRKAVAKYQRCKHGWWQEPSKYFRSMFEVSFRMRNKQELVKYCKDSDYEVQSRSKCRLPWES